MRREAKKKTGLDDFILANGADALCELIDKTKESDLSEALGALLSRFLYVTDGSYILEAATGTRYTVPQFTCELTANQIVTIGKRQMTAGRAFMMSPDRPEVTREVYSPGESRIVSGCFNRWAGWGIEPRPGHVEPFLELVKLLCPESLREWLLDWLAYPLQNPGAKLSTAVVLVAAQGVGKSTLGDITRKIYGPQNSCSIDQRVLDSQFNSPLACKQFVVGEETATAGRDARVRADVLKNLITAPTFISNEKYKPQVELRNSANFAFFTNHVDAFHLEDSDRRFAIIECADRPRDAAFYANLRRWLSNGGAEHVFHHLLQRDLSNFDPHAHAPRSEAKDSMIDASRSVLGAWVHELKENPDAVTIHSQSPFRRVLSLHSADELLLMFDGAQGRCTVKAMTRELKAAGFQQACGGAQIRLSSKDESRKRFWITREIPLARISAQMLAQIERILRQERPMRKFTHGAEGEK